MPDQKYGVFVQQIKTNLNFEIVNIFNEYSK